MKLELAKFPVKKISFDGQTSYNNGVLEIDKEAVLKLISVDKRIESADLHLAFPGDQTRIALVREAVEPRIKVSGQGSVFPGVLGPIETVGSGRTHSMPGLTVIASANYRPTMLEGYGAQDSSILDMWGPAQELSPFGSTLNVVLTLQLIDEISEVEAHNTIQQATLKLANCLAETTLQKAPEEIEVFELAPADASLPRIIYILGALTQHPYPHTGIAIYGLPVDESLPTYVHPNEFLDGAVTTDARHGNSAGPPLTWVWMNHPVILQLLRKHGKELNFLGVIFQRTRFTNEHGKKVSAEMTSQMARLLGAEGAIITGMVPSGNNFMDVMYTLQACEQKDIKSVLITPEWGTDETEFPLPFYTPEAVSIVSSGVWTREVQNLPKPAKLIGIEAGESVTALAGDKAFIPAEEVTLTGCHAIASSVDWWGGGHYTCSEF
jgi:glycine reductase